ncbi:MAG: hypothetical protein QMD46_12170, partial [Methanomicrobiales archaeon]|nr:hypothetical protein [Methanomicrobiales archaeon]
PERVPEGGTEMTRTADTWDVRTCLAGREIPRDIQPRDLQQVNPCQGCGGGSCTCRDGGGDHPARRP